jgi:hypothetical protein
MIFIGQWNLWPAVSNQSNTKDQSLSLKKFFITSDPQVAENKLAIYGFAVKQYNN